MLSSPQPVSWSTALLPPSRKAQVFAPRSEASSRPSSGRLVALAAAGSASAATLRRSQNSWKRRKNAQLYQQLAEEGQDSPGEDKKPPEAASPSTSRIRRKPEVLAPAGGWPQLRAAVENGADAVYFGLDLGLNARARAANFRVEELDRVVRYLRSRDVKSYVTLNTLVFDHELFGGDPDGASSRSNTDYGRKVPRARAGSKALEALEAVSRAGVDAVIVQDIGLALACRALCPNVAVHASTQMSITSAPGALFATRLLGADRVVVGRELSIAEIKAVAKGAPGVEVEAFVHGALCVSYSGQCFSSEAWGGRSANRGQCAQACRMPYGLVRNGELIGLGDAARYLLSPQDLMALDLVPELIEAGVGCFKIEGRLKGEEYVALTTAAYRQAIDTAWAELAARPASSNVVAAPTEYDFENFEEEILYDPQKDAATGNFVGPAAAVLEDPDRRRTALAQVFARGQDARHDGLTSGFLEGPRHQRLVRGRAPKHRGVLAGVVRLVDQDNGTVAIKLSGAMESLPLRVGVGLVFDGWQRRGAGTNAAKLGDEDEMGAKIVGLATAKGLVLESSEGMQEGETVLVRLGLRFLPLPPDFICPGDLVWRNSEPQLLSDLKELRLKGLPGMWVQIAVQGQEGEPLTVKVTDGKGRVGVGCSDQLLESGRSTGALELDDGNIKKTLKLSPELQEDEQANAFWQSAEDVDHAELQKNLQLPAEQVRLARQRALDHLLEQRLRPESGEDAPIAKTGVEALEALWNLVVDPPKLLTEAFSSPSAPSHPRPAGPKALPRLTVLCRTREQAEAAIKLPPEMVYEVQLDFLEAQGLEAAVASAKAVRRRVAVCLPRVLKPGEDRLWQLYRRLGADALIVRSAGALYQLLTSDEAASGGLDQSPAVPVVGDFSLNAANAITAATFLGLGLDRLTPTHDLNATQLCELARRLGPERAARLEVVAHQHLPIFHMEHCVFCRFLTKGNDYTDCGHPCEKTALHLRDVNGQDHRIFADMGCRNTVFNSKAQSAAPDLEALAEAGVGFLRLELVDESPDFVESLVQHYHGVLRRQVTVDKLWDLLMLVPDANGNKQGVGRGSLDDSAWRERAPRELRPSAAARPVREGRGERTAQPSRRPFREPREPTQPKPLRPAPWERETAESRQRSRRR